MKRPEKKNETNSDPCVWGVQEKKLYHFQGEEKIFLESQEIL